MAKNKHFTRSEIAQRIIAGENIVIRNGAVLRIPPSWLTHHPGGELAILHFVGREAGDEIAAYHSHEAVRRMDSFVIGAVDLEDQKSWLPLVPPLMSGWSRSSYGWEQHASSLPRELLDPMHSQTQLLLVQKKSGAESRMGATQISQPYPELSSLEPPPSSLDRCLQDRYSKAYNDLHRRVVDAGLYKTRYIGGYGPELIRYALLLTACIILFRHKWYFASAVFLGVLWHQLAFTAHDLGHNGVTHTWVVDRLLGILVANVCGGLSIGWWVDVRNPTS